MSDLTFDGPARAVRPARALAAAPVLGAAMATGLAPLDLWFAAFPAMVLLFAIFARLARPGRAAFAGWLAGTAYFAVALRWIVEPFQVEADIYGWMAPFALIGMAGGLALFWAAAFWGAKRLGRLWPLVPVWALAELARGYVLTGFPWAMPGYLWETTHLIQLVSIIGPYGLTTLTFAMAAGIVAGWGRTGIAPLVTVLGLPLVALGSAIALAPDPMPPVLEGPVVRIVQPNAAQRDKWNPALIPTFFGRQVDYAAADPRPDLVVLPETALPMLMEDAGEAFSILSEAARGAPVVVGVQRRDRGRFYNSLAVVEEGGVPVALYDKHHLVPFGEYMPLAGLFARFNIIGLAARAQAGYTPGPGPRLIDLPGIGQVLPLICYEAVFPQYGRTPDGRADVLLQITNDAWFGEESGPFQHVQQARIRAIEQGLPLIRAANTGVSVVVDGKGRVLAEIPLGVAGFADAVLPPPLAPTIYARTGDLATFLALICLLGLTFLRRRKISD